jgi:cytochrome c biogenesis protein CcdA
MRSAYVAIIAAIIITIISTPAYATCATFFYGDGCPHCADVQPIIAAAEADGLTVERYEIYQNRTNALLLDDALAVRGVPQQLRVIPAVIIADEALLGSDMIERDLESAIARHPDAACDVQPARQPAGDSTTAQGKQHTITLSALLGAAFVDSINPCAIAVLLILLTTLLAAGDRRRALIAGIAFTTAIYISYLLFGLGLLSALRLSGIAGWFSSIVAIIAIIIGLANIKDFFWYGGAGFIMEIPRSWRPTIKKILGGVTSPVGAFFAGFAVCLFELPCTGGPYLVVLGMLADTTTIAQALPLLLLYNLVFVLPLIIITALVFAGLATTEQATAWKERNLRALHLVAGIVMLVLGILLLLR